MTQEEKIAEAIKRGYEVLNESECADTGYAEYWYKSEIKEWEKNGSHRIYVNLNYGRFYKGRSKWRRGVSWAIDINTLKSWNCSRNYNNSRERGTVQMVAETIVEILK